MATSGGKSTKAIADICSEHVAALVSSRRGTPGLAYQLAIFVQQFMNGVP